jgi:general secretion pathway protein J
MGFTLLELLVAVSVLALLGVMAWRGLDRLIAQRERVAADTARTERIVRTLAQIERDVAQRIPDALFAGRYGGGGALPLALQFAADREGRERMQLLRVHPGVPGAQAVVYAVESAVLVRRVSDLAGRAVGEGVAMLDGVRRLDVRLLLSAGWTEPAKLDDVPGGGRALAMELTIEQEDGQRYVQVLQL